MKIVANLLLEPTNRCGHRHSLMVLCLTCLTVLCSSTVARALERSASSTSLLRVRGDKIAEAIVVSADAKRVGFVEYTKNEQRIVVNGKAGRLYAEILPFSTPSFFVQLCFSPRGARVAYKVQEDDKQFVVVDDDEGRRYKRVSDPLFDPGGSRVAYVATDEDGKETLVLDGNTGDKYDDIDEDSVCFSPDGKRTGYRAKKGDNECAVVDGKEGRSFWMLTQAPFFSPDSKRVAYVGREKNRPDVIILDGKPWPTDIWRFAEAVVPIHSRNDERMTEAGGVQFTPDSAGIAYVGSGGGDELAVIVDGKPGPRFRHYLRIVNRVDGFLFAPRGGRVALVARREVDDRYADYVIVGDEVYGPYYEISNLNDQPVFSPDGSHVAWMALDKPVDDEDGQRTRAHWFVVVDGKASEKHPLLDEEWPHASTIAFSPDGKRIVYAAPVGPDKFCIMLNGKENPVREGALVGGPEFSPDGQRYVYSFYSRKTKKAWAVLDEKTGNAYDDIRWWAKPDPRSVLVWRWSPFSPNGKHIVYIARSGSKECVVVDDTEGTKYDAIFVGEKGIVWDAPNKFHYLGCKGNEIYLVEEALVGE